MYLWEFNLNKKDRKVQLMHSRISGKRRVYFDGKEILKSGVLFTYEFSYSFSIDNHYVSLVQTGPTTYDLRIDNTGFNSIITALKKSKLMSKKKLEEKELQDNFFDSNNTPKIKSNSDLYSNDKNKNKKEHDDGEFFNVQTKDTKKNQFDEEGFDFGDESNNKNENKETIKNNNQLEDIFGLGFA